MSKLDTDDQEDKPLDPVMEKVRRKMVRLQLVSAGIMLVMFMAVLGAIVYKVTRPDPRAAATTTASGIPVGEKIMAVASLPKGFQMRSISMSGGQLLFFGAVVGGDDLAIVYDIATARIVAQISVR